jgi:hypothetical protein
MLQSIYDSLIMNMNPNHEEILWLLEQAEKVKKYEIALKEIASRKGDYYEDEVATIAQEALDNQ